MGGLGLILYNSLALTESRVLMELFNQTFVKYKTRKYPDKAISASHYTHTKSITKKESYRWIEGIDKILKKKIMDVADREADIYEICKNFDEKRMKFVVRAKVNRSINKIETSKTKVQALLNIVIFCQA